MLKPPSSGPRDASIAVAPRSLRATLNGAFRYWRAALAVFLAVLLLGVLAAVAVPPAYRAQARLLVLNAGVYDMQGDNGAPQTAQGMNPTDLANVEIQLLESAELHRAVARTELGAGANAQAIAQRAAAIESALHVTKATEANVVELNYSDRDSVAAARTLRTLLDAYFAARAQVLTSGRLAFLNGQLAKTQADLDAIDRQIVGVQRENGVVDIAAQVATAVQQSADLRRARLEAEAALAEGRRSIDTLRRGAAGVPRQVEIYSDNSEAARAIGEMQNNLLQLRARRADIASRYMADSPQVQQLDKQIAGLEASVTRQRGELVTTRRVGRNELYDTARDRLTQAEAAAAGNAARQSALSGQEGAARGRMEQLIGVSDTLARLRLQRDILADSVRAVATRVEQARIQQNQAASADSTNVRIVEAPTPPERRSNPPALFIAAGLVGGLALAAIALVLLASVRSTFLSAEEAARALDLPVLPVGEDDTTQARAFAEMAAAVEGDGGGSTLLLLSPTSRADLQRTALGLGTALDRRAPGRVILVRFADGTTAGEFGGAPDIQLLGGIATTVVGADVCARRGAASALLVDLRRRWDHVVITAPPVDRSYAGIDLASLVDAVMLVLRADATPAGAARTLAATVRERGGDVAGAVLVGVRDHVPAWLGRRLGTAADR